MQYVSFDIETATITPENDDPHKYRPLGICCAATQLFEVGGRVFSPVAWCSTPNQDMVSPAKMEADEVRRLVDYLSDQMEQGYIPLTWNGLGFDFDILAEECQDIFYAKRCAAMAMAHVDMAFQMLCDIGYMIGMQAAALGQGLPGKSEGMHGDLAPKMWAEGAEGQAKVLAYVKQDVQTTTDIMLATMKPGSKSLSPGTIFWTSKAGRRQRYNFTNWLVVSECLKRPLPDTSWMSDPRTRESCYRWIKKLEGEAWETETRS